MCLLRKMEGKFSSLYLTPDKNKQERTAHQKLIAQMSETIEREISKHYFVRDNEVKCLEKHVKRLWTFTDV